MLNVKALLIAFAAGLLLMGVVAFKVHGWRVDSLRVEWESEKALAVGAVRDDMKNICDKNNRITKENAHALQAKYDTVNRNYDRLLRATAPRRTGENGLASLTGRDNGAPAANVPALCIPVLDLAAAGRANDKQAAALMTLQDVVAEIYIANGRSDLLPAEYTSSK